MQIQPKQTLTCNPEKARCQRLHSGRQPCRRRRAADSYSGAASLPVTNHRRRAERKRTDTETRRWSSGREGDEDSVHTASSVSGWQANETEFTQKAPHTTSMSSTIPILLQIQPTKPLTRNPAKQFGHIPCGFRRWEHRGRVSKRRRVA